MVSLEALLLIVINEGSLISYTEASMTVRLSKNGLYSARGT